MRLLGVVTSTGSAKPGFGDGQREATLSMYFDGSEVAKLPIVVDKPAVGQTYSINIERESRG